MKRTYSIITLLFCLMNFGLFAVPGPDWSSVYKGNGENADRFTKIISDGTGNFIAVGYSFKADNAKDILTVKYDSSGTVIWSQTNNGSENGPDEGVSVGVDGSGNVFVTGVGDGGNTNDDIVIIKYDANGVTLWDTTWDSPSSMDDVPVDLVVDAAGNCFIGGVAEPDTNSGSADYITLKYDANGVLAWFNQYSRTGVLNKKDELKGIAIDANGDVYVTGRSENSAGDDDFVTIKYDGATGAQSWLQTNNFGGDDKAVAICVDNAGSVIVTGSSDNAGTDDIRTVKFSSAGLITWIKVYDSPTAENDSPQDVTVDASNNVIVVGESDITGGVGSDLNFVTIKYNAAGTIQWASRTTGNTIPQDDSPVDVVTDPSGNIYVTGITDQDITAGVANNDWMTVMYNPTGTVQWTKFHAGTRFAKDDDASSLVYFDGSVYVVGASIDSLTQKDGILIKYQVSSGNETFLKEFNGKGDLNESARSLALDGSNNAYTAGYSYSDDNKLDAIVNMFDFTGNLMCSYIYNGAKDDDDEFEAVAVAPNGTIYACGSTKVDGQKKNLLLVKINPGTCDSAWTRTYDYVEQTDAAEGLVVDAAGDVYVTGRSDSDPQDTTDNNDIVTMKFDSNGNLIWTQRYGNAANLKDEPAKIILDNAGNVIVAGRTENVHDDDFVILKYNSASGTPVWATPTTYGGPFSNDDRALDVAVDGSDNIYAAGFSQTGSGDASTDPVLLKFDAAGAQLAFYSYAGVDKDEPVRIAVDPSGNVVVAFKFDAGPGLTLNNYDIQIQKFDTMLVPIWASPAVYDSPIHGDDIVADMIITPLGEIYVTGSTEHDTIAGRVNKNWIILGYSDQGVQYFSENFNGAASGDDSPNAMLMKDNFLWVAGYSTGDLNNQKDITVNRYSLFTSIAENSSNDASVYPNPFNTSCTVTFKKPVMNAQLEMFDMLGNSVSPAQTVNGNTCTVNRGDLASGLYQFTLKSENAIVAHGKLIIQ